MLSNRIEDQVNLFVNKCSKLDLPPECYPDINYLRKIFRQSLSFFELFNQKVDTKQDVDTIRKNILVAKMKNSINEAQFNESLPKEYKNYIKYSQLIEKLDNLKTNQKYLKQEELQKLESIQENELKLSKAKESMKFVKAKSNILQAKLIKLNSNINEEEILQKKIKDITPAKFSISDNVDDFLKSLQNTIKILKGFQNTSSDFKNFSEKIWKQIESQMKKVPNNVTFQMILKQLSSKIDDSILTVSKSHKNVPSQKKVSDQLLPQLYQQKIITGIELQSLNRKLEANKPICAEKIEILETKIESQLNSSIDYSFQIEEDDVIGEFLSILIAKLNVEGKIRFCTDRIASMKLQIEGNLSIAEYEQLVNDTKTMYGYIDEKISSIQEHVAQIHQINEKINFSKISVMRMLQSLKMEKSQQHNRTLLNQTLNCTVMINSKENEVSLPKHEMELEQFLDVPVCNFNRMNRFGRFSAVNDEILIFNMINIAGRLAGPHVLLEIIDKKLKFGNDLKSLTNDVPSPNELTLNVNFEDLQKQRYKNSEEISLMLDEVSKLNVSINANLRTIKSLLQFCYENPLRKFVPKTKKFDGKSYDAFEKEYMLYYKMITK